MQKFICFFQIFSYPFKKLEVTFFAPLACFPHRFTRSNKCDTFQSALQFSVPNLR